MRKLGIFALWGVLYTIIWEFAKHAVFDFCLKHLESWVSEEYAVILATASAFAFPLIASGALIGAFFLGVLVARRALRRRANGLPEAPARSVRERPKKSATILITPPHRLLKFRFGLLHVRDGKDEVKDRGPLLNVEIPFNDLDGKGNLVATVEYDAALGFQFKCFVDHKGDEFRVVKEALEANGFLDVNPGMGAAFRAWFLLPGYPTCVTVDGFENNFVYPA